MPGRHAALRAGIAFALLTEWGLAASTARAAEVPPVGLRVPDGFEVSLYADDDLAHDIFSLTFDARGRVVVSGPGYVRILIDSDGDGRADMAKQYADGPASGAQGMYFLGGDLLCTGDAGLIRYRDRDLDDRADGPPDVFLRMKTGSEHHVHSVQKGPDGWWYLIAGNFSGVNEKYAALPTSPVKSPQSGVVYRLRPDLSGGEIVCDGLRNAYDFTFHPQGDLFAYDSDGEREVSLPWYQPTRVFHLAPGSHAGWITESFKQPNEFAGMPPAVADLGRGSPTGVACYRHTRFPAKYHGAVFALDWTFGRVLALPLRKSGSGWKTTPIPFITSIDDFGFAPTDAEVGPDGALYVSVGGRGTRGSVFRVAWKEDSPAVAESPEDPADEKLLACLNAPMPLSSWSRAEWEPAAAEIGAAAFVNAARNDSLPTSARIRAIEILTELFAASVVENAKALVEIRTPEVRARAAWAIGRVHPGDATVLRRSLLASDDPLVARAALESLAGIPAGTDIAEIARPLAARLGDDDPLVRQAAMRVVARLSVEQQSKLVPLANEAGARGVVAFSLARLLRAPAVDRPALELAVSVLEGDRPVELKREAVRLLQLALGDVGPTGKLPPVYDGYTSRIDLAPHERVLDPIRARLARVFPDGDAFTDHELGRVLSMLAPLNSTLLGAVVGKLTEESNPIDDVHWLIVASRIPVERTAQQRDAMAAGFVLLDQKLKSRGLPQDTNWLPRITELYRQHVVLDPTLPGGVARHPAFGRAVHVTFLNGLPRSAQTAALRRFVERSQSDGSFEWTSDLVFVLGDSGDPAWKELVRKQWDNMAVRPAVLMVLAAKPEEQDRNMLVTGLDNSQLEVLTACLDALQKLPTDRSGTTQAALVRTLRRLGSDPKEISLRDMAVRQLERNTGLEFRYKFGAAPEEPQSEAIAKWTEWVRGKFPQEAARQAGGAAADVEAFKQVLSDVDWNSGDGGRGRIVFEKRQCGQCHGGARALGPDLAGATRRFSREDLFTAIVDPSRDVSPRYQTTLLQTRGGKLHTGLIINESVDGLLVRTAANQTLRLDAGEIEERRTLAASLMPVGLLRDAAPQDVADLYAYLRSLAR